jgi:HSP20 family protein
MSTLFPYDLLFRDFFKSDLDFQPATQAKFTHPVDIFETDKGLHFEVACTGLSKEDVNLDIEGDILKISYNKEAKEYEDRTYIHTGVAKRSFNLGYKIASKFDLSKAEAMMENGLLGIKIPYAEEAKPKSIKIK